MIEQTPEEVLKLARTIKAGDLLNVSFDDGETQSTVTTKATLGNNDKDIHVNAAAFYPDEQLVVIEFEGVNMFTDEPFTEGGLLGIGVVGLEILKKA